MNNSKREYKVTGFDGEDTFEKVYTLIELLEDDGLEVTYTLQDDIDAILDLKEGESMFIPVTRDGDNKGVIKRLDYRPSF